MVWPVRASRDALLSVQASSVTTSLFKSWQKAMIRAGSFHLLPASIMCNASECSVAVHSPCLSFRRCYHASWPFGGGLNTR